MAILLIRHGETAGNRNRIIQVPETPLSDRGLAQAARLGQRLAKAPITEIWTSHLPRARMTAAAIESTTGVSAREEPNLEERSLGDLRGTAYDDLDFDPFGQSYAPPAGETWEVFNERVDRMWEKIERHWVDQFSKAGDDVHFAVVSHGLFLRSLIERHLFSEEQLATHATEQAPFVIANTSLTVVSPRLSDGAAGSSGAAGRDASSGELEHHVKLIACAAHLEGETAHDVRSVVGI
ncbi:MAG: histidine phosphatase family protein [Myxococcales bacterium]|nr:histidine phosphatase family protein [Myxococcales bacterium]HIK86593.1 histidine phosphatase family protein [Myxococcales bacterium]